MIEGRRRGLLLLGVLIALPLSASNYARRVDAVELGVNECLDGGALCVDQHVGWGFGRVLRADGDDVVLTLRGGREVALVGWRDRPDLEPGLVISVGGTYRGAGRLEVTAYQLHPRRWLKETVGIAGLGVWMLAVVRFAWRRTRS